MANLDSILKSRDITLPTKVRLVKAMVFPVVMYGCESWTIKKAVCVSHSVMSNSLWPNGLYPTRLPCPWDFPGKNPRVGSPFLLQRNLPEPGIETGFPALQAELYHLSYWAPKNWCFWTVVLEKSLENPLDCKEIKPVHPKGDQSWIFIGRTDADAESPVLRPPDVKSQLIWKDPDAGKDWRQKKKVGDRGWDGWMASPTQWTWVWAALGDSEWQRSLERCSPWGCKEADIT